MWVTHAAARVLMSIRIRRPVLIVQPASAPWINRRCVGSKGPSRVGPVLREVGGSRVDGRPLERVCVPGLPGGDGRPC